MKVCKPLRPFFWIVGLSCLACVASPARVAAAPPAPTLPSRLRILSDIALPPAFEWAADVRWATDRSVYLALGISGTVETGLRPTGPAAREWIPGKSKPGGFWAAHRLAASSRYLVVAGPASVLTWRRLAEPTRVEEPFEAIQALDVRDDRLAILGLRQDERGKPAPDGAIAWIGPLEKGLARLKPILYDVGGPGAPTMDRCVSTPLGALRFLPDGSLAVVPGVQAGVHLYNTQGKLVRTWDTGTLGIDTDCAGLSYEQSRRLIADGLKRQDWINQRRTVTSLLPLPHGIGLIVRRVEGGWTRWDLKVLHPDGSVQTYPVPLEGSNGFFDLLGDARAGEIVFLLRETLFAKQGRSHPTPPRLIVAKLAVQ